MRPSYLMRCCWALCALVFAAVPATAQHTLTGELPKPAGSVGPDIVVVAGATGRTGRLIVSELQKNPRYVVRALARDPKAAAAADTYRGPRPVQWLAGDVRVPDSLVPAFKGATYVISAIGATERSGNNGPEFVDYGGVKNLTDAARAAGARQLVLISSMGVESGGGFVGWILNIVGGDVLEWKAKGEDYLRRSSVPYTIIRPGGLREDAGGAHGLRLQQGDEGMGSIARADVARVTVATLGNPAAVNKTFEVREDDTLKPGDAWVQQFRGLKADVPVTRE